MIGLLQRVTSAAVDVDAKRIAQIGPGILVLVGVERGDTEAQVARLADRLCNYRVFGDEQGRMNLSVAATGGGILLVPQFTLAANTRKGTRASFTSATDPETGKALYQRLVTAVSASHRADVQTGRFGAEMQVSLVNDGPVTFWLRARPP